jgi:hypothetical protein
LLVGEVDGFFAFVHSPPQQFRRSCRAAQISFSGRAMIRRI